MIRISIGRRDGLEQSGRSGNRDHRSCVHRISPPDSILCSESLLVSIDCLPMPQNKNVSSLYLPHRKKYGYRGAPSLFWSSTLKISSAERVPSTRSFMSSWEYLLMTSLNKISRGFVVSWFLLLFSRKRGFPC